MPQKTSIKKSTNPYSTGGGGNNFEIRVGAYFAAQMAIDGHVAILKAGSISKIIPQAKALGFETDDLVIFGKCPQTGNEMKLLTQSKRSIKITKSDTEFEKFLRGAWLDFNSKNPEIFNVGSDKFVLITGLLDNTVTRDLRDILAWADGSKNSKEFFLKLNAAGANKKNIAEAFKAHLTSAKGATIAEEELWEFLKHFSYLHFDLDEEPGMSLPSLKAALDQYYYGNPDSIWAKINLEFGYRNQSASSLTKDELKRILKNEFRSKQDLEKLKQDWNQSKFANEISQFCLVGSWNEKNVNDNSVISELVKSTYETWIKAPREVLQNEDSPIAYDKSGVWSIKNRLDLWEALAPRIFDEHLSNFKNLAVKVLSEKDPKFELPVVDRYMARILGKSLTYSEQLREGLAETLALIGNNQDVLKNCTIGKAESIAVLTIREIFQDADWIRWATLNNLLPVFAEVAPNEFLTIVERTLKDSPEIFKTLFEQEGGDGFFTGSSITGLLWALETLAWEDQYLSRVSLILAELDHLDPGGKISNRPKNSLVTIFLPWLPQTLASVERRKIALKTICLEFPEEAWKVLIKLLRGEVETSSGTRKPQWRKVTIKELRKGDPINNEARIQQELNYADMVLDMAKKDPKKLKQLVARCGSLPPKVLEDFLDYLASDSVTNIPEIERTVIWEEMTHFINQHKRFPDAQWAFPKEILDQISEAGKNLAPSEPLYYYKQLFSQRAFDKYDIQIGWDESHKLIQAERNSAIIELLEKYGFTGTLDFAKSVGNNAFYVGYSVGLVAEEKIIKEIDIKSLLGQKDNETMDFVSGLVHGHQNLNNWKWCDDIDFSQWNTEEIANFLVIHRFENETWKIVEKLLGKEEGLYWRNTTANLGQNYDVYAIKKLIEYGRPYKAIHYLYSRAYRKMELDPDLISAALLAAVASTEKIDFNHSSYEIVELIRTLQSLPNVKKENLIKIEYAFLNILNEHSKVLPITLWDSVGTDPSWFVDAISLMYKKNANDEDKRIAQNAYTLVSNLRTVPGMKEGKFLPEKFNSWFEEVKNRCERNQNFDKALYYLGQVLIHAPQDPDGLWINHAVAKVLNDKSHEKLRNGFRDGIRNSRGAFWIDPERKEEKALAAKYKQMAEAVESHGYSRLATTLKDVAESYERESKN